MTSRPPFLLLAFISLNCLLYVSLLPLWEGFDEAYHYAYVDYLATQNELPVLGKTVVSDQVDRSLRIAPLSHVVAKTIPGSITSAVYLGSPVTEREDRRAALDHLPEELRGSFTNSSGNYEAHQAPLAYGVLAFVDRVAPGLSLIRRVSLLRVTGALLSVFLLLLATTALAKRLGTSDPAWVNLIVACVFSSQMLYASICHVANDWLAIPLAVILLVRLLDYVEIPSARNAAWLAVALGLGLLTKAYFLSFLPALVVVSVWLSVRRRFTWVLVWILAGVMAAPWYVRNLRLYGNLTGMVEESQGVGLRETIAAIPSVPWLSSIAYMARGSLWTGNNHFTTFSRVTINCMLALIVIGLLLYAWRARRQMQAGVLLLWTASFCAGLAFVTAQSYLFRNGESAGGSVWYTQPLLAPVVCAVFVGYSQAGRIGKALAAVLTTLSLYVIAATYVAKLIPLYTGYPYDRIRVPELLSWYTRDRATMLMNLHLLAPAGAMIVLTLCVLTLLATLALWLVLMRAIWDSRPRPSLR